MTTADVQTGRIKKCGPGVFNIGRLDFFYACCTEHDCSYDESIAQYVLGVVEHNTQNMLNGLELKTKADEIFFSCLEEKVEEFYWPVRWLARLIKNFYTAIIISQSSKYWAYLVIHELEAKGTLFTDVETVFIQEIIDGTYS